MRPVFLVPALIALAPSAAGAQVPAASDFSWGASASVMHRRLQERADSGSRLVRESGAMLRLALDAQLRLSQGGALRGAAGLAGGGLDYQGRTQGGLPVDSTTHHRELDLSLAWRPLPASSRGEGWLVLHALQQRRTIAATASAGGLRETSTFWMPALRWTHGLQAAGWNFRPSLELRFSAAHDLDIDYGGVFDPSELRGGRRRDVRLGLQASAGGSPWQWGVEWTHTRQSASAQQALFRNGTAVGNVRQPKIRIDDISLSVRRAF